MSFLGSRVDVAFIYTHARLSIYALWLEGGASNQRTRYFTGLLGICGLKQTCKRVFLVIQYTYKATINFVYYELCLLCNDTELHRTEQFLP